MFGFLGCSVLFIFSRGCEIIPLFFFFFFFFFFFSALSNFRAVRKVTALARPKRWFWSKVQAKGPEAKAKAATWQDLGMCFPFAVALENEKWNERTQEKPSNWWFPLFENPDLFIPSFRGLGSCDRCERCRGFESHGMSASESIQLVVSRISGKPLPVRFSFPEHLQVVFSSKLHCRMETSRSFLAKEQGVQP